MYGKNNHGDRGDHWDKSDRTITFHFLFPVRPALPVVVIVNAIAKHPSSLLALSGAPATGAVARADSRRESAPIRSPAGAKVAAQWR